MRSKVRRAGIAVVLAVLGVIAASCSSSGSSKPASTSSSGSSASPSTAVANGSPIKVMALLAINTPVFGYPEQVAAIKAHVAALNAAGGINGHPIQVTSCNDNSDPNTAAQCAQQAVTNGDVAVLGGISLEGTQITGALAQASIPYVGGGPITPGDYTSPISFPVGGGTTLYVGVGDAMVKQYGCKKIDTIVSASAGAQASANFLEAGVKAAGGSLSRKVQAANVVTDYSPAAATVAGDGADCVNLNMAPNEAIKAIPALHQGAPNARIFALAASVPLASVSNLGAAAEGIVLADDCYPTSATSAPGVQTFLSEMQQYGNGAQADSLAMSSWTGAVLLGEALKTITGTIDAKAVLAAMGQLSNVTTPCGIYTTTSPNPAASFARVFDPYYVVYTVKSGNYDLPNQTFVSAQAALSTLG